MQATQQQDGEYFVDAPTLPVAPADTWETLSVNQLIDVKNTLTSRYYAFQNQPAIAKTLSASLGKLDALIARRLASG